MFATQIAFFIYLSLIAAIGFCAWRRTKTIADYLLGGRRLGAGVAALSAGASDMSGWLLLGLPGLAVVAPASAVWTAVGLLIGTWANWRFVAAPLREVSASLGALTLPEFFALRFARHGELLRILSALSIVLFFLLYTSAGLVAGGKLFNLVFAIPYAGAVVASATVITAYTLFGGFLAVAWTDTLQALMMTMALGVIAVLSFNSADSIALPAAEVVSGVESVALLSALAWGLGYMGQPHILTRFMAMHPRAKVTTARRIALCWTAFGLVCAVVIGATGATLLNAGDDPERVFMIATAHHLPPWLSGLCLAAILAAIMSTADSQLLVTSAALAEDLLPRLRPAQDTPAQRLLRGRIAVVLVCALATLLALDPQAQVLDLVARAWAGFGATLGPALLISLHSRRASATGAVAGMLCGATMIALWPLLPGQGFGIYELLPAFMVALSINAITNRYVEREARDITNAVRRQ
jgi:sodium/proline symporter